MTGKQQATYIEEIAKQYYKITKDPVQRRRQYNREKNEEVLVSLIDPNVMPVAKIVKIIFPSN